MQQRTRRGTGKPVAFALLFVFWLVLSASLLAADLVLGAISAALAACFALLALGRALDEGFTVPVLLRLPLFGAALVWEIIKANIDVALIILNPRLPIDPRVTSYRTFLRSDLQKTFFADSITLTPGTVTLEVDGDTLYVHCLAAHHEEGLHEGRLERMVAWLFGVSNEEGIVSR